MSADRDLLFGMLALKTGLIERPRLLAAFRTWSRAVHATLAEYLVAAGDLGPEDRDAIEAVVARQIARHGDAGSGLAAIPADRSTRERFAQLRDLGLGTGSAHADAPGDATIPDTVPDVSHLSEGDFAVATADSAAGRFRILRPHAQGGLGAVFVALDIELNREVALKRILDAHADDPTSRARFLIEAEITGGLEHPGIVPVYSLGASDDGRPYYAMRFIRGDSLKEAIDAFHGRIPVAGDPPSRTGRRSLELRQLLRRFVDLCHAIDYAHSRGVLHRDIKPSNVIVGKHGETLVVDWGLAKATGRVDPTVASGEHLLVPGTGSGSAETLPGYALGSPSYMSPEQAGGDVSRLGPRSDVYSLGATLYHLLTGRPPRTGEFHVVMIAARSGVVAPPRRHDPTIDRALEAVCLRAMAPRPEDRYPGARTLAEDIERWMADEPVSAWREPITRRAQRWVRRHRTAVATAAMALVVGVIGLSAVLVVQRQANVDIAEALGRETLANEELTRSRAAVQARYDLALEAIRALHTGVSREAFLREERFRGLRQRLLSSAAGFYIRLADLLGQETDPDARRALNDSRFELATLTDQIGDREEALKIHREVLAAREAVAAGRGAGLDARGNVAHSLLAVAALCDATGRTDEALAAYRRARAVLEEAAGQPGAGEAIRRDLAETLNSMGLILSRTGRTIEAESALRASIAAHRRLTAGGNDDDGPRILGYRAMLASAHHNLGSLLSATGRTEEAEARLRDAMAMRRALHEEHPDAPDLRLRLAATLDQLGALLRDNGRPIEAEARLAEAIALHRGLAGAHPTITQYRSRLALSLDDLALLLAGTGRPEEAEARLREATAIQEALARENPAVTYYRSRLSLSRLYLGRLLADAGRTAEARALLRDAIAIASELAAAHPGVTEFGSRLADSRRALARLEARAGRLAEAEAQLRDAKALCRSQADANPEITAHRDCLADADGALSAVFRRRGCPAEARDRADRAIADHEALTRQAPRTTAYRAGLAEDLLNRALARRALDDRDGAASDLRRALALLDTLSTRSGENWFITACCRAALAGLEGSNRQAEAAVALLRRAIVAGFRDRGAYHDDALDPIRSRDDVRRLLMDLDFPDEPFATRP